MTLDARKRRDHKKARTVRIYLDGRMVPHAFYADGRRGVVKHWRLNDDGRIGCFMRDGYLGPMAVESRGRVEWRPLA